MYKLELSSVSYLYSRGTPFEKEALSQVSVGFEAGKITGILGHTGSGKSTLAQLLNGLLPPTEGKVYLDGKDIWENPKELSKVRYRVGLVMQYPEYQLFDETVEADIGVAPRNMGLSPEEIRERVNQAASFVGLTEDLLKKSPLDLSGGQKRRAALAGIIAMRPEVLVLDEPAAGLDPKGKKEIFRGLCRYKEKLNATVLIVSHSMEDMALYCDNIVVMKEGGVLTSGSVGKVFSQPEHLLQSGLDLPGVYRLALGLRENGIALDGNLYTVDGVYQAVKNALKSY
ncbi:MAG: energy-coupling factor transporter ATPase [Clostridia bacterium]|nr:energy-coupling factor transporter ATPase [Clostridia bacterium]